MARRCTASALDLLAKRAPLRAGDDPVVAHMGWGTHTGDASFGSSALYHQAPQARYEDEVRILHQMWLRPPRHARPLPRMWHDPTGRGGQARRLNFASWRCRAGFIPPSCNATSRTAG